MAAAIATRSIFSVHLRSVAEVGTDSKGLALITSKVLEQAHMALYVPRSSEFAPERGSGHFQRKCS